MESNSAILKRNEGWVDWKSPFDIPHLIKKNVPGDGSCQFASVAESLYPLENFSPIQVRAAAAQGILTMKKDQFEAALVDYRLDKKDNRFQGGWDPHQVHTVRDLANQVLNANLPGCNGYFWGDNVTLWGISFHLNLDIYILEELPHKKKAVMLISVPNPLKKNKKRYAILLWFNRSGLHYQSLGVQHPHGKQTIFLPNEIPKEVLNYMEPAASSKAPVQPLVLSKRVANPPQTSQLSVPQKMVVPPLGKKIKHKHNSSVYLPKSYVPFCHSYWMSDVCNFY